MSTNGSFAPPVVPECEYAPRMTRAQAVARMFAGTLNPNCVVVITDGPVIGTTANTSPTEIEMQPVTASDIGRGALVHTTFSAQAWTGTYDLNTNTIFNLLDDWGNSAVDEDPGAPTVHTQVPWHRGSATFSGNNFDTAVLPGVDIAVGDITDNDVQGSTVNLTGMTGAISVFRRNQIRQNSSVTVVSNQATVLQNVMRNSTVNCQSGSQFGFLNNNITSGSTIVIDAATTGRVAVNDSEMGDSYRLRVNGFTGTISVADCLINGNRMVGKGNGVDDLVCSGSGAIAVTENDMSNSTVTLSGTGPSGLLDSYFSGVNVTKNAASTAPLNIVNTQMFSTNVTMGAANACTDNNFTQCEVRNSVFNFNGPVAGAGLNAFVAAVTNRLTVTTAATATAGVAVNNGTFSGGTITQNRAAGTSSLHLFDCSTLGLSCSVTDNGTVDPVQPVRLEGVELVQSTVTFGSVGVRAVAPAPIVQTVSMTGSTLNVTGLAGTTSLSNGRLLASTVNNAGFTIDVFTADGMAKTLGANQTGRAASVAFDNYV